MDPIAYTAQIVAAKRAIEQTLPHPPWARTPTLGPWLAMTLITSWPGTVGAVRSVRVCCPGGDGVGVIATGRGRKTTGGAIYMNHLIFPG